MLTFLDKFVRIVAPVVLFYLMFCFAATIHPKSFRRSLKSRGIFIGVILQLVIMPFIGFILLQFVEISEASTIVFMVLLSSPGGTFSNFLNSIFNGDLSLSVAMTTVSTLVSIPFLPFNLFLYLDVLRPSEDGEGAAARIDWAVIGRTVAILISGVLIGLYANRKVPNHAKTFYRIANVCAILQIVLALISSNRDSPIFEKPPELFIITSIAVFLSMGLSLAAALCAGMKKAELFSVVIEVAVQNSSVSIAFSASAFRGAELSEVLALPVIHGILTTFLCIIFAIYGYNAGWTYSPKDKTVWTALSGFYQPHPDDFDGEPLTFGDASVSTKASSKRLLE